MAMSYYVPLAVNTWGSNLLSLGVAAENFGPVSMTQARCRDFELHLFRKATLQQKLKSCALLLAQRPKKSCTLHPQLNNKAKSAKCIYPSLGLESNSRCLTSYVNMQHVDHSDLCHHRVDRTSMGTSL